MRTDDFFSFARERHAIWLRRRAGLPRSAWTEDAILQTYRFTNVFRELDRTTVWFRENVRDRLRGEPEVLLATVLFRWFNRIQTGEAIFQQTTSYGTSMGTPWDILITPGLSQDAALGIMKGAIRTYCGGGPYVTGAYIIKTPDGYSKLDGVLWCVEQFLTRRYSVPGDAALFGEGSPVEFSQLGAAKSMVGCTRFGKSWTLEDCWAWLRQFPFLGDFMAYEIVTDLRHTAMLDRAPDIMTWANPGPGAMNGLNYIHERPVSFRQPKTRFIQELRDLLEMSRDTMYWPNNEDYPAWEMRDVEHTACEFQKYARTLAGTGAPKQRYR